MNESRPMATSDSTAETNRALAIRWFQEVWNDRRPETIDELFASDGVGHMEGGDQDREGFKAAREGLLNAFPDMKVTVEDTIADGNRVAVRWSVTGKHRGDGLGMPATNKDVHFRGISWMVFENGVMTRGWDSWNLGHLLESLR